MKIKTKELSYEEVLKLPGFQHKSPVKPGVFWRFLLKTLSAAELRKTNFQCKKIHMEKLGKEEPCLILMNHSSFIDLKIASTILYPRPFNIVCTYDGFVGKKWLMEQIGCIPTIKFTDDLMLIKDMVYAVKELKSSVLMFPEASYSFDGTKTLLPESLGKCVKLLKVPVVVIRTHGAFARDPLYNNLQIRQVDVSAEMEYLLSPEQISQMTVEQINEVVNEQFSFDQFKWQQDNQIAITEEFRADFLNRVLYKCPACHREGKMLGKGISLTCEGCKKQYVLTEDGYMQAVEGETEFPHIPDWYSWERECVKKEVIDKSYRLDIPVEIYMMVNTDGVYHVGTGRLVQDENGFALSGCDGKLRYKQSPFHCYSLYADYYWYEIGDVICVGDKKVQYYCFPQVAGDIVAKTRLATEELYRLKKKNKGEKR